MRILGITAEYDPFHNGHKYHLETAKAMISPDAAICVMSGDITQRGHLAVLDKWERAGIALDHGVDMVLELPFLYACSPAKSFAQGAVDILAKAGATHISFGCEAEDPDDLMRLARLQEEKRDEIESIIIKEMKSGVSNVKARQIASTEVLGEDLTILSLTPNNILAIEYLKRMDHWKRKGACIEAVPIVRKGSGYKEAPAADSEYIRWRNMAGGSAIREMISAGWDVSRFLPYDQKDLNSGWNDFKTIKGRMMDQLKGIVIRKRAEDISKYRFIGEGIEHRFIKEINNTDSFDDLLRKMTSRRYTTSTIRRMILSILIGITKEAADEIASYEDGAAYGRILALGEKGRKLIAARPALPFISNVNKLEDIPEIVRRSLEMDIKAADLFNLLTGRDMHACSDHRKKPYIKDC